MALGQALGPVLERVGTAVDLVLVFVAGPACVAVRDITDVVATVLSPVAVVVAEVPAVFGGLHGEGPGDGIVLLAGELGAPSLPADPPSEGARLRFLQMAPSDQPQSHIQREVDRTEIVLEFALAQPLWTESGSVSALDVLLPERGGSLVLSEGFAPVGQPLTVTGVGEGRIEALALTPAAQMLAEVLEQLDGSERRLAAQGVYLGVQVSFGEGEPELVVYELRGTTASGAVVLATPGRTNAPNLVAGDVVQFVVSDPQRPSAPTATLLTQRFGAPRARIPQPPIPQPPIPEPSEQRGDAWLQPEVSDSARSALIVCAGRDPRLDLRVASDWGTHTHAGIVVPRLSCPQVRNKPDLGGITTVLVFD